MPERGRVDPYYPLRRSEGQVSFKGNEPEAVTEGAIGPGDRRQYIGKNRVRRTRGDLLLQVELFLDHAGEGLLEYP